MYGFFFEQKNGGFKVTIKVESKRTCCLQAYTLTRINLVDNINISNRTLSHEFNSLHVKFFFTNGHQNG
jgi:hypothetical protein